jgi:DNA-binding beta-propeller fold protein YncE
MDTLENKGIGEFNSPHHLPISAEGYFYVVDGENHRVQVFDQQGEFLRGWSGYGFSSRKFNDPWRIAIDSEGNIYVADTFNHRVQKFTSTGALLLGWRRFGDGNG